MKKHTLILLDEKQIKKIAHLYKKAENNPMTGSIVAQCYEGGFVKVEFLTPEQVIERAIAAIVEREKLKA